MPADQLQRLVGAGHVERVFPRRIALSVAHLFVLQAAFGHLTQAPEHPVLSQPNPHRTRLLRCSDRLCDLRLRQVCRPDPPGAARAVAGPDRRLRRVQIDEIFLDEALLPVGQGHGKCLVPERAPL